jgi:hypothetical protein
MLRTVLGLFEPDVDVRPLLEGLRHANFRPEEIGLLMPLRAEPPVLPGWLVAARPTPFPNLGVALVAGPVAPALTGTCAGPSDLRAALLGVGVDLELAALCAEQVRSGQTMVLVRAETGLDAARRLLVPGEPAAAPSGPPGFERDRRQPRGRGRHRPVSTGAQLPAQNNSSPPS